MLLFRVDDGVSISPFSRVRLTEINMLSIININLCLTPNFLLALLSTNRLFCRLQFESITMSYKAGIIIAITELKDRTGSSSITIKKHMQANLPADKKWLNGMFLNALKKAVVDGDFVQNKSSYKLSADYKKKAADASKPKKVAPKKKAAPKKKTAPKKKAVSIFI